MIENESAWIDEAIRATLERQFPGFEVTPAEFPNLPAALVGQIGFQSTSGTGSLGVVAHARTLSHLEPVLDDLRLDTGDWVGELANQVLGRVKLEIAGPMSEISNSIPIVLRETSMGVERTDAVRTFRLERDDDRLGVWIDLTAVRFDPDAPESESDDRFISAGECVLFL